jgi:hypothetical protein
MAKIIGTVIVILFLKAATAQNVKGSWYGRADVITSGTASNYLTELILRQKGNEVEGIFGYYFKDSYQSFFIRGTYDPKTRLIYIRKIPLLFYGSPAKTAVECPMNFQGKLMVSKVQSTITGTFYTEPKYRYTCPEIRVSMKMDPSESRDSALDRSAMAQRFWKPQAEDVVFIHRDTTASQNNSTSSATAASSPAIAMQKQDSSNKRLIEEFGRRNNIYQKDIVVYDDSILVSFYDNGDIDDDTISVFLNKKPVLIKRGLTSRALNIYIGLDSTQEVHELSMFADNLGKFPPNTALMVISDRQKRYELYLSASLKQNASVRLRRPRTH